MRPSQLTLFEEISLSSDLSGLTYIPNFIAPNQEAELIHHIDAQLWLDDLKRRVQHYGWKYDYKAKGIRQDMRLGDIPSWLVGYVNRLHQEGHFPIVPDQVIVNEYQPGQGIAPHVDCVPCFGEVIASISLSSPCVMEFTKEIEKVPLLLEPRSLVVMSGDARYQWKHSIPQRKTDTIHGQKIFRGRRLSLTFRTVVVDGKTA